MKRFMAALAVLLGISAAAIAQMPEQAKELAEAKRKLAALDSTSLQFKTYKNRREMRQRVLDARPKPKLASPEEMARRGEELAMRRHWKQMQQQAAFNAWMMAAVQPQRPTPAAPQAPYYPLYPVPFSESILHNGHLTTINGYGPYGPFSESILQNGPLTTVDGYGIPPYVGVGPGF